MNHDTYADCAGCGGPHLAQAAHTIDGRPYCAPCWPDAPGLELLRSNAVAAALQGVVARRYEAVIGLVDLIVGGARGGELVNAARVLHAELANAGADAAREEMEARKK